MSHIAISADLLLDVELGLREFPGLLGDSCDHVLDDLDHEDTIVTLSSERGVSQGEVIVESAD